MTAFISYGGGTQSTALVVLAATGRIEAKAALFANVGDDSEYPATLAYVREVAVPWAAERGLPIHELHKVRRDMLGKDHLYLTRFGKRLSNAIGEAQPSLFDVRDDYGSDIGETGCDEGVCFV